MTMSKLSAIQISDRSVANLQERVNFLEKLLLKDKASYNKLFQFSISFSFSSLLLIQSLCR